MMELQTFIGTIFHRYDIALESPDQKVRVQVEIKILSFAQICGSRLVVEGTRRFYQEARKRLHRYQAEKGFVCLTCPSYLFINPCRRVRYTTMNAFTRIFKIQVDVYIQYYDVFSPVMITQRVSSGIHISRTTLYQSTL